MTNQPLNFASIGEFAEALDAYEGDNVWEDLIYGTEIKGDEIDEDKSADGDGCIIFFKSGEKLIYSESAKEWLFASTPFDER